MIEGISPKHSSIDMLSFLQWHKARCQFVITKNKKDFFLL